MPFNPQIFDPNNEIVISSDLHDHETVKEISKLFFTSYFPIDIVSALPNLKFAPFDAVKEKLNEFYSLNSIALNHPGGSVGYKITQKNKSLIYLCDNEFEADQRETLTAFAEKADVLIWDGMFTEKELVDRRGWGHSSIEQAIKFNEEANCKKVLISHHAPARSDQDLDHIASSLPELFTVASDRLEIEV